MYNNSFVSPLYPALQQRPKKNGIEKFLGAFSNVPLVSKKVNKIERGAIGFALAILSVVLVVLILGLIPLYKGLNEPPEEFSFEISEALAKSQRIFEILSKDSSNMSIEDKIILDAFKDDFIKRFGNSTDTNIAGRIARISVVDVKPHKDNLINVKLRIHSKPMRPSEKIEISKRMNYYAKKLNSDLIASNAVSAKQQQYIQKQSSSIKEPNRAPSYKTQANNKDLSYHVLKPDSEEWNYIRNVEESKFPYTNQEKGFYKEPNNQNKEDIASFVPEKYLEYPVKYLKILVENLAKSGAFHHNEFLTNNLQGINMKYFKTNAKGFYRNGNQSEAIVQKNGLEQEKENDMSDINKNPSNEPINRPNHLHKHKSHKGRKIKEHSKETKKKQGFFRRLTSGITLDRVLLASNYVRDGLNRMGIIDEKGGLTMNGQQDINKLTRVLKNMLHTANFNERVNLQLKQRQMANSRNITDNIVSFLSDMINSQGNSRGGISLPQSIDSLNSSTVNEVLKSVVNYLKEYKEELKLNQKQLNKVEKLGNSNGNSNLMEILLKPITQKGNSFVASLLSTLTNKNTQMKTNENDFIQSSSLLSQGIGLMSKIFSNFQNPLDESNSDMTNKSSFNFGNFIKVSKSEPNARLTNNTDTKIN